MRQKSNIPADAGHFLSTKIESIDFKNENLTTKIRTKQEGKPYLFKKIFQKMLK